MTPSISKPIVGIGDFSGKGGKAAVFVTPPPPPVQQGGEASTGHRMDVKALTLIQAQVQILQTSSKADFYLHSN